MSLRIDATSENVSIADAASIRDLTSGSAVIWCRPTSVAFAGRFFQKPNTGGGNGREFSRSDVGGNMLFFSERSTATLQIEALLANFAAWALDAWMFVVVTWDEGSAANCRLLVGSQSVIAAEPSSYTVQDAGSGTIVSDDTQAILVGNRFAGDRPFSNDIAHFSVYNRAISVAEAQSQQFRRRPISGCVVFLELGYHDGTGTQRDYSGTGNTGTVNSATVATHVPLPFGLGSFQYRQRRRRA